MDFVTGATGMLGAHLILILLKKGRQIRALKTKHSDIEKTKQILSFYSDDYINLFSEIEWVDGDLLDYNSVVNALKDVDTVYNCASLIPIKLGNRAQMIEDNANAARNLAMAAKDNNIKYFCHVSSIDALGEEQDEFKEITENSQRNPKGKYSAYSQAKFMAEMEIWKAINEGLPAGIINPSVILGPGDWQKGTPQIFDAVNKGLKHYVDGVTGFVGVKDVVACMLQMTKEKITGQRFIVNSQNFSCSSLLELTAKYLGVKPPKRKISNILLKIVQTGSYIKAFFLKKRATITTDFINKVTGFHLYSNTKSKGRLIADYKAIDLVLEEICQIYKKDTSEGKTPKITKLKF